MRYQRLASHIVATLALVGALSAARAQSTPSETQAATPETTPQPPSPETSPATDAPAAPSESSAAPAAPAAPATAEAAPPATEAPPADATWKGFSKRKKSDPRAKPKARASQGFGDYQLPLRFDPEDNGLSIDNPQLRYNMPSGDKIDLGGLKVEESQIDVVLSQVQRDRAPVRFDEKKQDHPPKYVTILSLAWPELLTKTGTATIETYDTGDGSKVIWSKVIDDAELKHWNEQRDYATKEMREPHDHGRWGIFDIDREQFAPLYAGGIFRACLNYAPGGIEKLKICTRPFKSKSKGDRLKLFMMKKKSPEAAGITFNDRKLANSGIINFTVGTPIVMHITFDDTSFIDIGSQPADPGLLDVVQSKDGDEIILTGSGAKPIGGKVRILSKPITHFWAPTGIPQERIWQVSIPRESPTLRVRGAFNIPFTLFFRYDRLPTEGDRVFIQQRRSSGTYSSSPVVQGYTPNGGQVASEEYSVRKIGPYRFAWSFAAPKRGDENRAHILINSDGPKPWVAHYKMYRSYPYEISGRLTGILASDFTFIFMGELSAAAWFETLAGLQSPTFSKQRWGLATRYLKSLTSIQSSSGASVSDYTVTNLDLKYNILPGIWHRDEIVGMTLSTQMLTLAGINANLLGAGAYWARTMPKIFNELFNLFPLMDYPKYVDMEFIYYPMSLSSGVSTGATFNLNFHGRVFWTHRLYGEAGFGIREYDIAAPSPTRPGHTATLGLSTAYGTFGIGAVF